MPTSPAPAGRSRDASRLVLGTVQLGMAYGLANPAALPAEEDAEAIIEAAWTGGVRWLDTARAYGEAEDRIGAWRAARGRQPRIVSKFAPLQEAHPVSDMLRQFEASLAALGTARLDGWLAHRPADLLRPGVQPALERLVGEGQLGGFGASVYRPEEARAVLPLPGLSMIQLPFSVLDRRFAAAGLLSELRAKGCVVFARSVFLQGALFLEPAGLPRHLAGLAPALDRLQSLSRESGLGVARLALGWAMAEPEVDLVLFGAYTVAQAEETVAAAESGLPAGLAEALDHLAPDLPEALVDPSAWPR